MGYDNFGNAGDGIINQSQIITTAINGDVLSNIASINHLNNTFYSNNIDVSLSYKRTYNKEDKELEISLNGSFENNRGTAKNYQLLQPNDSLFYGTNSINPGKEYEKELQVDYTQPFKEDVILGIGSK